jgi:hypothetical protein
MTRTWIVASAGLRLAVAGPEALSAWWPSIATQVPGAAARLASQADGEPEVVLPDGVTSGDARRRINAAVHVGHLRRGALCVHGVGLARDGIGVLLLGGHGSGKSLTGLAMITEHGWRPAAGDTCIVQAVGTHAEIIGGTTAYVVRRQEAARRFPGIAVPGSQPDADIGGTLGTWCPSAGPAGARLAVIASVLVGSTPGESDAEPQPGHVAVSALYRASSYLLDKVLDDPDSGPLRLVEDASAARSRDRLSRWVASSVSSWWVRGTPEGIAAEVTGLALAEGSREVLR